jgi:outer membrane biosynthesis protein TonB
MDTNRPSDSVQGFNGTKPFWRNVVLIALLHVALIAGLIRWSTAARASANTENIVWLGGAEDQKSESEEVVRHSGPSPEPKAEKDSEVDEEKPAVAPVKSEIELPSPTPKPSPTQTPRPKASPSPTPKPKPTAKPIPKATPKKTLVAKATPKPSHKEKPTTAKANQTSDKAQKKAVAKKDPADQNAAGKNKVHSSGLPAGGSAKAGGNSASEFGWYGNMLHDRFYSAWIQPTTNVPSNSKFSALVQLRIDKDGRVAKFEMLRPSDNPVVNESVAAVAKQVTEVDAPPTQLIKGDHYDVKINFELNTANQ